MEAHKRLGTHRSRFLLARLVKHLLGIFWILQCKFHSTSFRGHLTSSRGLTAGSTTSIFAIFLCVAIAYTPAYAATDAATVNFPSSGLFQPLKDDASLGIIALALGDVGGGISDINNMNLGKRSFFAVMIAVLNRVILYMAIFMLLYQLTISVVNTAKSGRFLGERGAFWMPIRSVLGIALLFPNYAGYCLAQLIVIKIIIAGIGVADSMWAEIYGYLDEGTSKTFQVFDISVAGVLDNKQIITPVIIGAACMAAYKADHSGYLPQATLTEKVTTTDGKSVKRYVAKFLADQDATTPCLEWEYAEADVDLAKMVIYSAQNLYPSLVKVYANKTQTNYLENGIKASQGEIGSVIAQFAVGYSNFLTATNLEKNKERLQSLGTAKYGWLSAGFYFRNLLHAGGDIAGSGSVSVTNVQNVQGGKYTNDITQTYTTLKDTISAIEAAATASGMEAFATSQNTIKRFAASTRQGDNNSDIVDYFTKRFSPVNNEFDSVIGFGTGNKIAIANPFTKPVQAGGDIMRGLIAGVVVMFVTAGFASLILSKYRATSPQAYAWKYIYGILSMIMMVAFSIGYKIASLMAIYLPMIPLLIFIVGVLGWLIYCLFAIVSAPLVALGIVWPDRNQGFMGKSSHAVLMYLNLLLRPSLMLLGLFAGTILCSIGFYLILSAFTLATSIDLLRFPRDNWFIAMPLGMAIVMTMIAVAQKSYGLITLLPDRVLSWIGGQMSAWSFTQDTGQIVSAGKSGMDKGLGETTTFARNMEQVSSQAGGVVGRLHSHHKEAKEAQQAAKAGTSTSKAAGGPAASTTPATISGGQPSPAVASTASKGAPLSASSTAKAGQTSATTTPSAPTTTPPAPIPATTPTPAATKGFVDKVRDAASKVSDAASRAKTAVSQATDTSNYEVKADDGYLKSFLKSGLSTATYKTTDSEGKEREVSAAHRFESLYGQGKAEGSDSKASDFTRVMRPEVKKPDGSAATPPQAAQAIQGTAGADDDDQAPPGNRQDQHVTDSSTAFTLAAPVVKGSGKDRGDEPNVVSHKRTTQDDPAGTDSDNDDDER